MSDTITDAERSSATPDAAPPERKVRSRREAMFRWTDLVVPLVCAAAVGLEVLYLSNADLDRIERRVTKFSEVWRQTVDHAQISFMVTFLVLVIAVPLGVLLTRKRFRWMSPGVLIVANTGQAAPVIGLLAILGIFFIGLWAVVLILTAYSALPVLRNTIVGLQQVDEGVKDAARGMGMSPMGVLLKVELPLAIPIIGAGARIALVLAVASVPFGDYLGAGGLGGLLFGAIKLGRNDSLFLASLLIAVLALLLDWAVGLLQRALTPPGIR